MTNRIETRRRTDRIVREVAFDGMILEDDVEDMVSSDPQLQCYAVALTEVRDAQRAGDHDGRDNWLIGVSERSLEELIATRAKRITREIMEGER